MDNFGFYFSHDQILAQVLTSPKVCVPCLQTGCTLQASLPGERVRVRPRWKLPAALGDQLAQTPAFYILLQAHLYQSQSQSSQLPCLWNGFIMWTYRQFLLEFPPGILILGKITFPIRDNGKGVGACVGGIGLKDLTFFPCCHPAAAGHFCWVKNI